MLLNYLVPEKVFVWVTSIATFGAIWTWAMILLAQLRFRKTLSPAECDKLQYRMWLYPLSSYLALAFLVMVVVLMAFFEDTRIASTSAAVHPAADRPVLRLQPGAEGACRHRLGKPRGVLSGVAPEKKRGLGRGLFRAPISVGASGG